MKKVFACIVMLLVSTTALFSQNGIVKGRVVSSANKEGLAYVTVVLNEIKGTYTSDNGEFEISGVAYGTFELLLSSIGFETRSVSGIVLSAASPIFNTGEIMMTPKDIMIEEITITEQQKVYDTRYAGTNNVISAKTLQKIQPIGSEEVIKLLPGVNVASDMEISNRPNISIRGSDPRRSNKILLLEDGSPISPAPYLSPGTYYNVPTERLDGIQVIKGPDVLIYGSNTIYGVVNYITKRPPLEPTLSLKLTGGERGYFSTVGSYGSTWNKTGAEIQGVYKQFNGYMDNSDIRIFNLAGKLYSELTDKQSIYLKLIYQTEYLNTTWNGNTQFTFDTDPTQNPFDADEFTGHRYGIDLIHNYKINNRTYFQSKIYGSDFYRDWWKQSNLVIAAEDVQSYVGDEIFHDRYSYLENMEFEDDDYVRVGKVVNGVESTIDSRWQYYVFGLQEKFSQLWGENELEAAVKWHSEIFSDVFIIGDSSRWARSGRITGDVLYHLNAFSGYVRNRFEYGRFSLIPVVRYEKLYLQKNDLLAASTNTGNTGGEFGTVRNDFGELTPGLSIVYQDIEIKKTDIEIYVGAYRGFSSPTSAIAFNEITNGEVVPATDIAELKPEISFNQEIGTRIVQEDQVFNAQFSVFNTFIDNYYSPARSQAFQSLGSIQLSGAEFATNIYPTKLFAGDDHELVIGLNATYMSSAITGGTLNDGDLFSSNVFHTDATKNELIDKINEDRNAYEIYLDNVLYEGNVVTIDQFSQITKVRVIFGDGFVEGNDVPYVPEMMFNANIGYTFKNFNAGVIYHYVSDQYTEFLNFENETADGGIGKLPAYYTIDINAGYSIPVKNHFKTMNLFITGKNITNQIYKSSRLNRASGGIFPAGFIQINGGVSLSF